MGKEKRLNFSNYQRQDLTNKKARFRLRQSETGLTYWYYRQFLFPPILNFCIEVKGNIVLTAMRRRQVCFLPQNPKNAQI